MKSVSKFILGTANFGKPVAGDDAIEIINYALYHGVTAVDTADSYGDAEEIVGKALLGRRDSIFLATKVGNLSQGGSGLSSKHIEEAMQDSLRRLQTDYVDLYQAHNWDKTVPLPETLRAFNALVRDGRTLALGCSNFTASQILESLTLSETLGVASFTTVQPVYNLIERHSEDEELPLAVEKHLSVWAYSPLAGGILTGKYSNGIPSGSRAEEYPNADPRQAGFIPKITKENIAIGTRVVDIAQKFGITPAQLAIAWIFKNPAVTSVIIGVRNLAQLREILNGEVPKEAVDCLSI